MAKRKNAAAVQLGRKGGKIGGKRRAETLTPEQLSAIGRQGAAARWGPPKGRKAGASPP
jgi:hypothetical protein